MNKKIVIAFTVLASTCATLSTAFANNADCQRYSQLNSEAFNQMVSQGDAQTISSTLNNCVKHIAKSCQHAADKGQCAFNLRANGSEAAFYAALQKQQASNEATFSNRHSASVSPTTPSLNNEVSTNTSTQTAQTEKKSYDFTYRPPMKSTQDTEHHQQEFTAPSLQQHTEKNDIYKNINF